MLRSLLRCSLPAAALLFAASPLRADTLKVPAQFETIQAAIDAAGVDDVIQVSKGVYAENVVINKSDLTLKGKGATINGRYQGNCVTVTGNNVVVESLTLVNGGGSPPADGTPTGGIFADGTGIELSKLTVVACEFFGIQLVGTGAVESCKVDACAGDGINVETNDPEADTPTVISKNTVTRCNDGIVAEDGPFTIEKNTIEQNGGNGIELDIPILVADGGATLALTTVSKNQLRNNGGVGLEVQYEVDVESGVLVEKNTIEENGAGVELFGFNIDVMSNTIQNNIGNGILVVASSCTLEKNKVKGNGRAGIIVVAGEAPPVDGVLAAGLNQLHQNTVQDNGADGVLILSSNNEVHDSTIKDNKGDGIDIEVGANGCVIENNKVTDNEHDGIDNSALDTVITGNQSKNNGGADIAGAGDGAGTVSDVESVDNVVSDDSDLDGFTTVGELDMTEP